MLAKSKIVATVFLIGFFFTSLTGQTAPNGIRFLSYDEAERVIRASGDEAPPELRAAGTDAKTAWNIWIRKADHEIRARLEQGDEDSIVNLLLFGTSFTGQPRITESQMNQLARENSENSVFFFKFRKLISSATIGQRAACI